MIWCRTKSSQNDRPNPIEEWALKALESHLSLSIGHHQRVEPEVAPVRDLTSALLHEGVPREGPRRDGVGGPEEGGARPGRVVGLAGQLVRQDVIDVERVPVRRWAKMWALGCVIVFSKRA